MKEKIIAIIVEATTSILAFVVLFFNHVQKKYVFLNLINIKTMQPNFFLIKKIGTVEGVPLYHIKGDKQFERMACYAYMWEIDKVFIVVNDLFYEYFTEAEQAAIVGHELGHISNGDHLAAAKVTGWQINENHEWAADKASAEKVGAKPMISVLRKIAYLAESCWPDAAAAIYGSIQARLWNIGGDEMNTTHLY